MDMVWEQDYLSPSCLHSPCPHITGTSDPISLWTSSAALATATLAGDTPQHGPLPCGQKDMSCPAPLPLLCPASAWPSPFKMTQGTAMGWDQAAQVNGTQGTSPILTCGCRPPACQGVGKASRPGSTWGGGMPGETLGWRGREQSSSMAGRGGSKAQGPLSPGTKQGSQHSTSWEWPLGSMSTANSSALEPPTCS